MRGRELHSDVRKIALLRWWGRCVGVAGVVIVLALFVGSLPGIVHLVEAHPGNTDSDGCHTCRTNCSKWGISNGFYHDHHPVRACILFDSAPSSLPEEANAGLSDADGWSTWSIEVKLLVIGIVGAFSFIFFGKRFWEWSEGWTWLFLAGLFALLVYVFNTVN